MTAPCLQLLAEHHPVGGVVVDDQDPEPANFSGLNRLGDALLLRKPLELGGEKERGPLAELALRTDPAAHRLRDLFGDRQPQPGSTVLSGGGGIRLREGLEQPVDAVGGDPDAGVDHLELQRLAGFFVLHRADADQHLARFRELDGVVCEVDENLAQTGRVALHMGGYAGADQDGQLQALLVGLLGQHVTHLLQGGAQVELDHLEFHLARLDLGEIEDVVDQPQERFSGAERGPCVVALLGGQIRVEKQPGHAQDPVHRRADLVAHVGQKRALGQVGALSLDAGAFQLGTLALQLAGVSVELFVGPLRFLIGLHQQFFGLSAIRDLPTCTLDHLVRQRLQTLEQLFLRISSDPGTEIAVRDPAEHLEVLRDADGEFMRPIHHLFEVLRGRVDHSLQSANQLDFRGFGYSHRGIPRRDPLQRIQDLRETEGHLHVLRCQLRIPGFNESLELTELPLDLREGPLPRNVVDIRPKDVAVQANLHLLQELPLHAAAALGS